MEKTVIRDTGYSPTTMLCVVTKTKNSIV